MEFESIKPVNGTMTSASKACKSSVTVNPNILAYTKVSRISKVDASLFTANSNSIIKHRGKNSDRMI